MYCKPLQHIRKQSNYFTPTPEKITILQEKSKIHSCDYNNLSFKIKPFFEKNLQWTIRFESINKESIILYVQSKRPLILWKKTIALNELGKCAEENFSLAFKDQCGAPQLVLTALQKNLFCYFETLYLQSKHITVTPNRSPKSSPPSHIPSQINIKSPLVINSLIPCRTRWYVFN